jgi:hypothetical protein
MCSQIGQVWLQYCSFFSKKNSFDKLVHKDQSPINIIYLIYQDRTSMQVCRDCNYILYLHNTSLQLNACVYSVYLYTNPCWASLPMRMVWCHDIVVAGHCCVVVSQRIQLLKFNVSCVKSCHWGVVAWCHGRTLLC